MVGLRGICAVPETSPRGMCVVPGPCQVPCQDRVTCMQCPGCGRCRGRAVVCTTGIARARGALSAVRAFGRYGAQCSCAPLQH